MEKHIDLTKGEFTEKKVGLPPPEVTKPILTPCTVSTQILKDQVIVSFSREVKNITLSGNDALTLGRDLTQYGKQVNRAQLRRDDGTDKKQ